MAMWRKVRRLTAVLFALLLSLSFTVSADAVSVIDEVLSSRLTAEKPTVQQWIDSGLTEELGSTAEWYVLALSRQGNYDFSAYRAALAQYLEEQPVMVASTRQKLALSHLAAGGDTAAVADVVDETLEKQGVMSRVFGLHLLNNGCPSERYTAEQVVQILLDCQLSDGGWAVMGKQGDVDTTAMVLQALSVHRETAQVAIDHALVFLSERQGEYGDYEAFGEANPESAAQVVIALSSLNIDAMTDTRFIKNGKTLFDGIARYRLENGTYCHTLGDGGNEMATVQVFCAAVAYQRMADGYGGLYRLDEPGGLSEAVTPTAPDKPTPEKESGIDYRLWVTIGVAAVAGGICLYLALKRRGLKNLLSVLVVAALLVTVVWCVEIRSVDDYYSNAGNAESIGEVTVSVRCDKVAGKADHLPKSGEMLPKVTVSIAEGDTVYDVLVAAAKEQRLHIETNGSGNAVYVEGIGNLYEFEYGELSGWVYLVNGKRLSSGCGSYVLSAGDTVEWHYSLALGDDIA